MTESIHHRALEIAGRFKKSEIDLITIIQEIDEKKAFFEKQCTSTFDYCVKFLKLSDNQSLDYIVVARASKKVPALKQAIEKKLITISKARRIASVITKQNSSHWLDLAQSLSKEKLQKEIAKVNPQVLTPERAKYVTGNRLKLELGVSEEFMKNLRRVQEILSQKNKTHVGFESALGHTLEMFLNREDPVKKAERASKKVTNLAVRVGKRIGLKTNAGAEVDANTDADTDVSAGAKNNFKKQTNVQSKEQEKHAYGPGRVDLIPFFRTPVSAKLRHSLNLRDQTQCTYIDENGDRCLNRKWLHFHHLHKVSDGGRNELDNLTTLCSGHHRLVHKTN